MVRSILGSYLATWCRTRGQHSGSWLALTERHTPHHHISLPAEFMVNFLLFISYGKIIFVYHLDGKIIFVYHLVVKRFFLDFNFITH